VPLPEELGFFQHSREKRRLEVIARLVSRAGVRNVLDVGAASGWLAETLARRGLRVSAVDLGLDSIRRAEERLKARGVSVAFVQGDIYRLPFAGGGLDAVTASEIIEHLEDPPRALREVARVLRPGGTVVLCAPYRERIETTLCIHCNQKTPVNAHLHSFSGHGLAGLLAEAGFTVERMERFLSRPAERFGLSGLTAHLPFPLWRATDALACRTMGRECYIAVRAVRNA
jgi:ubiquinone/menaquinone biosynthesis C-methylase UbiE